jgi:hypothetical protein
MGWLNRELGSGSGEKNPARWSRFWGGGEFDFYGKSQPKHNVNGWVYGKAVGPIQNTGVVSG